MPKKIKSKLLLLLIILMIFPIQVLAYSEYIIAGGENIGIELNSKGIVIVGTYKVNGGNPAEDGYLVDGQVPRGVERLLVGVGIAEMADALPHCVAPGFVVFLSQFGHVAALVNHGVGGRVEREGQGAGEVPADVELAVPHEVLAEGVQVGRVRGAAGVEVAQDGLRELAVHVRVEAE